MKKMELARFIWRQLTSMRTALILLLLLALASIPGSLLPQRGANPIAVNNFIAAHPGIGKLMDNLKLFDVFSAPWFTAIYILLFISMIGCVIPRTLHHFKLVFRKPPAAPKFLNKLEGFEELNISQVIAKEKALSWFKAKRYRVRIEENYISAEKGYLRESGNLLFHLSLILLLIGVSLGSLFSFNGEAILNIGDKFLDTPTAYDSIAYGRLTKASALAPFALTIKDFHATYNPINNAPSDYRLEVLAQNPYSVPGKLVTIKVNSPLTYGATKIYLQANGYSPLVTVRDKSGQIIFNGPTVFLPQDANLTSVGAIKIPDTTPQLGFVGTFVPTYTATAHGIVSSYPESLDPRLLVGAFSGNLGLDSGVPQSIYRLDSSKMSRLGTAALKIGQSYDFGEGTISFDGYTQWVNLQIFHDPGKDYALLGAILAVIGLLFSLLGRSRRIWIKFGDQVEMAGLSKSNGVELLNELSQLKSHLLA
jgi:cytochrome c biogenesis protein